MVFVALVALLVIGLVGLRAYMHNTFGQDRINRLSAYDTEILEVPEDWQDPATLPSDKVVDFQFDFYNKMAAIGDEFNEALNKESTTDTLTSGEQQTVDQLVAAMKPIIAGSTAATLYDKIHDGDTLTSGELQTVDQLVAAMKPIIAETSTALSLPDYTADMYLYTTGTEFLALRDFVKYTGVVALETARRGDCATAMDIAALPMRYLDYERPVTLIYELIHVSAIRTAAATIESISDQCTDVAALRHGLDLMNQLRDQVKPLSRDEWMATDSTALINRVKAFGYPVKSGPFTQTHLMQQLGDIFGRPYNAWAVEHFPDDDPRHVLAQAKLDSMRDSGPQESDQVTKLLDKLKDGLNKLSASEPSRKFFGFNLAALLVEVAIPNFDGAATRGDIMFAYYDLTRLHLAQRILELQSARQTTAPADGSTTATSTITELISSIPLDPFSSGTLRFRNETNQFYSVGPDADDDNQSVPYDATNGTFSDGDIFIKP